MLYRNEKMGLKRSEARAAVAGRVFCNKNISGKNIKRGGCSCRLYLLTIQTFLEYQSSCLAIFKCIVVSQLDIALKE